MVYSSFFADFGPFDLGLTYKFCVELHEAINSSSKPVLYNATNHPHTRSNSAVLICAYLVLLLFLVLLFFIIMIKIYCWLIIFVIILFYKNINIEIKK
jgi:hypothetical protein